MILLAPCMTPAPQQPLRHVSRQLQKMILDVFISFFRGLMGTPLRARISHTTTTPTPTAATTTTMLTDAAIRTLPTPVPRKLTQGDKPIQ